MKGKRHYFTRSTTFDVAYLINNSDGNIRQLEDKKISSGRKNTKAQK